MKRLLMSCFAVLTMLLITGCPSSVDELAAPEITGVVADSNSVTLTWAVDSSVENNSAFSGYNIYVTTDSASLMDLEGDSLNKDNTTIVTANTYTVDNLSSDTLYYFQVRTVNTDDKVGEYNAAVPLVSMQPRPEYVLGQVKMEILLNDSNEVGVAIRFSTGQLLNEVGNQFPNADVFCDAWGPNQNDSVQIVTASARPNGRATLVVKCDSTYTWESWDFSGVSFGTSDRSQIAVDDLLLCKTTEGNYVKVLVESVDRVNNQVGIKFAYQTRPDYPHLSP